MDAHLRLLGAACISVDGREEGPRSEEVDERGEEAFSSVWALKTVMRAYWLKEREASPKSVQDGGP